MKCVKCNSCGFIIKEKLKTCPLCHGEMKQTVELATYGSNLPKAIAPREGKVRISYICYKCRKKTTHHICLDCNLPNFLCVEYGAKRAIIQRIEDLSDVFTEDEVKEILQELSMEEKSWIYYNLMGHMRFFYRKDKTKAAALFFIGALMFYVCLTIALDIQDKMLFVSYFINALGNGVLGTFLVIGLWYLMDASSVEYKKIAAPIAIVHGFLAVLQAGLSIVFEFNVVKMLISGGITLALAILMSFVVSFAMRKNQ